MLGCLDDLRPGHCHWIGCLDPIYDRQMCSPSSQYVFSLLELIYHRPHSFSQLNPKRIIQILHLPIRIIRFVTDPEVDLVIYIIQRLYQEFIVKHVGPIVVSMSSLAEKTLGEDTLTAYLNFVNRTVS